MISDRCMVNLRVAATMAHALPGLRVRLSDGDGPILAVKVSTPDGDAAGSIRACSPCVFRSSVAHAHRRHAAGESLGCMGMPNGVDPRIELGVPPNGADLGAGLFRVRLEDRWLWAMATTLPVNRAHELGAEVADAWGPIPEAVALGVRWDEATEVTLAYAETTDRPMPDEEPTIVDLMHAVLGRWGTEQLIDSVAVPADRPAPQR